MSDVKENDDSQPNEDDSFPDISSAASAKELGGQIGPYKLLSILGEGGFGIVYLAEQERPIKRRVALKVIKPGMDTRQVIARFEAERQALALLEHPNIARVFEAGTTEAGRPYFAMELVKGLPITEHCDYHELGIEERLELFLQVCGAVQHAHQKGIIHRDLKPSNILVSTRGGKPLPVIIDFGVAKAISQPLTERTLYTEQGQFVGTPEYMSPEQTGMTIEDIDTRSDVYSLGVILYELLTGTLPFDRKTLRQAAFDEILRMIREEDPPRPSTRLSGLGEDAERAAECRHTQVKTLIKRLHNELEWIPLKAMRKDRKQRYESASKLEDDIRSYLNGEPLIAGPESVAYRMQKLARKNRVAIAAIFIIALIACVAFAIGRFMYVRTMKDPDTTGTVEMSRIGNTAKESVYSFVTKWGNYGADPGEFNQPHYLDVDSSGNIYVADWNNARIQKFTSDGTYVTSWGGLGTGESYFNAPTGVAVDALGHVYVTDYYNDRVQKFTSDGTYVSQWGSSGSGAGQFNGPHSVEVDYSGYIYVSDHLNHRIQKFTGDGKYVTSWGSFGSGNGQFNRPGGIGCDLSGRVYVSDILNHRVQIFTGDGIYIGQFGEPGTGDGQFNQPHGIALDSTGNIYIADRDNHRIQVFTSAGSFVGWFGGCRGHGDSVGHWHQPGTGHSPIVGSRDGEFRNPYGIAFDSLGSIYVSELAERIQKFHLDLSVNEKKNDNINWPKQPVYAGDIRKLVSSDIQEQVVPQAPDALVVKAITLVKGITYSKELKYAVVGKQMVKEGDTVQGTDIKVVKINPHSVEFEQRGWRWIQNIESKE